MGSRLSRPARLRLRFRQALRFWPAILCGALALILASWRYTGSRPFVRGTVQTESARIWTRGPSRLHLGKAFRVREPSSDSISGVTLHLESGVEVELERITFDTLGIYLQAQGSSAGFETKGEIRIRTLGRKAFYRVILRETGDGSRLLYPFRPDSIDLGEAVSLPEGTRSAILLSGEVSMLNRTVSGDTFTVASRTLNAGEEIVVAAHPRQRSDVGHGTVIVSDTKGISVTFLIPARLAVVMGGAERPDLIVTPRLARYREDWVVQLLGLIVVYLLVHPVAAYLGERLTKPYLSKRFPFP